MSFEFQASEPQSLQGATTLAVSEPLCVPVLEAFLSHLAARS